MASYKIKTSFAGPFQEGQIVTDAQLKEAGADVKFWKGAGILAPVKILEGGDAQEEDENITQGELADALNGDEEAAAKADKKKVVKPAEKTDE